MEMAHSANNAVANTGNVALSVFTAGDDWEDFIQRLQQFFEANAIGEDRQVAILLTCISEGVHSILRNLCHPVRPITKTLTELVTLLDEEFKPKVPTYRKRIEFDQLRQNKEDVIEWYHKVKEVASKCEFGEYLDFRVKDKFVTGMKPGPVLDGLCEEETSVILSDLLEIALLKEAAFGTADATMDIVEDIKTENIDDGYQQGPQPMSNIRERHTIWSGSLEWFEKAKNASDLQKITRHVPFQVSANIKNGEAELKADGWPQKLVMQLMPKHLIGIIGGVYLRNSKSVLFHPQNCEALESLTKVMSSGFAGCVHFTNVPNPNSCDIKVLILLYTIEKRAYLGFIPNDQTVFSDRLRKVIQQQKLAQISRQL